MIYVILAGVFFGISLLFNSYAAKSLNPFSFPVILNLYAFLFSLSIYLFKYKSIYKEHFVVPTITHVYIILAGLFISLYVACITFAFKAYNPTIVVPVVYSLTFVFVTLGGALIFKNTLSFTSLASLGVIVLGLIMYIYSNK